MLKNAKSGFELKSVQSKDLEQFNELLSYVFQVTTASILKGGYKEGELVRAKKPVLERSEVLGWFKDGELVSQICVYPLKVNVSGVEMQMGGVTGVGTYPEYASIGLMRDLIEKALVSMKDKGQLISYLFPYSVPYYRRKGWEFVSDRTQFTIGIEQIPRYAHTEGSVKRVEVNDPMVVDFYSEYAKQTHGALIRSKIDWEEYWRWENEDERTAAMFFNAEGKAEGCLFYWVEGDVFYIKDFFYTTMSAWQGLWGFISAHTSMVDYIKGNNYTGEPIGFMMNDSQIEEKIQPYYMARIVDVESFLARFPFNPTDEIVFQVSDPMAQWNNGYFTIRWQGDRQVVTKTLSSDNPDAIKVDIGILTSMLMGYRPPRYYFDRKLITMKDYQLSQLSSLIPKEKPYFSDYF